MPLQHSELIEYSKILTIAEHVHVAATNAHAGNRVHTVEMFDSLSDDINAVFHFKGSYEDQELTKYKAMRVKLHATYTI